LFDLTKAGGAMARSVERCLDLGPHDRSFFGQVLIQRTGPDLFVICHCDDEDRDDLRVFRSPEDAVELARYDDAGNYRPLKTAPNLRHGWRLEIAGPGELQRALDYFYPGRLAILAAWKENRLTTTTLRQTLDRQSGMYRVASKISDEQIDEVVGNFCRSDDGCLRTILWERDAQGTIPTTKLPPAKFDPQFDQTKGLREPGSTSPATMIPLLCQEACNLLVAECRKIVKGENAVDL
jgi:sirohydrochlorin cobaltochelatase